MLSDGTIAILSNISLIQRVWYDFGHESVLMNHLGSQTIRKKIKKSTTARNNKKMGKLQ